MQAHFRRSAERADVLLFDLEGNQPRSAATLKPDRLPYAAGGQKDTPVPTEMTLGLADPGTARGTTLAGLPAELPQWHSPAAPLKFFLRECGGASQEYPQLVDSDFQNAAHVADDLTEHVRAAADFCAVQVNGCNRVEAFKNEFLPDRLATDRIDHKPPRPLPVLLVDPLQLQFISRKPRVRDLPVPLELVMHRSRDNRRHPFVARESRWDIAMQRRTAQTPMAHPVKVGECRSYLFVLLTSCG